MREARIFKNNVFCGVLREDEEGFHFRYDSEYMKREEAMTFEVGAEKTGFGRNTFIKAFTESGMNERASERLISKMCSRETAWKKLISESFLCEELKIEYYALLDSRLNILRNR